MDVRAIESSETRYFKRSHAQPDERRDQYLRDFHFVTDVKFLFGRSSIRSVEQRWMGHRSFHGMGDWKFIWIQFFYRDVQRLHLDLALRSSITRKTGRCESLEMDFPLLRGGISPIHALHFRSAVVSCQSGIDRRTARILIDVSATAGMAGGDAPPVAATVGGTGIVD